MNQGAKILLEAAIKGAELQELQEDGQWLELSIKEAIVACANQLDNEGLLNTIRLKPMNMHWYTSVTKQPNGNMAIHTPTATVSQAKKVAESWKGSDREVVGFYILEINPETMEATATFAKGL